MKALFTQCCRCFGPNLSVSAKPKDEACGAPAKARFLSSCERPLLPWLGFCSEVFWLENVSDHWPKYVLAKLFLVILGWRGRVGVRFRQHMQGDIFSVSSISCGNNVISQHCQIAPMLFQGPQDSKANLPASNVVPKIESPLPIQPVPARPNNPFSWKTWVNHQSIIGQHCSPHIQNLRKSQVHAQTGLQRDLGVCKVQNLLGQRLISSKYFPKNISLKIFFSFGHFSQQQHNSTNHHLGVSNPYCDLSGLHWCKTSSDKG